MNEHIRKILDNKLVYYVHVVVYIVFLLLNVEMILDPEVRKIGYPLPAAVIFTILFLLMFIVEVISCYSNKNLLEKKLFGTCFRVVQILTVTVFYFVAPGGIGEGGGLQWRCRRTLWRGGVCHCLSGKNTGRGS